MYSVKALGLNTKQTDRDIPDGFLQESINLQWRDEAFRPIPERLVSDIDIGGYENVIFHKVGDENQINVLGFIVTEQLGGKLALPIAGKLGGEASAGEPYLYWFGTILDGVYTPKSPVEFISPIKKTSGMSFTILNGILYFMGNGLDDNERYYYRVQYSVEGDFYEVKDMYDWKSLIHFYPRQENIILKGEKKAHNLVTQCGMVLIRTALVLNSGEVVLHSPIYAYVLSGINTSDDPIAAGDAIKNIHAFINLDFEFYDNDVFEQNVAAINIYAAAPYYKSILTLSPEFTGIFRTDRPVSSSRMLGELQRVADSPFYLISTIGKPNNEKLLLTVGDFDQSINITGSAATNTQIDLLTVAAGEIMPVDNFTYHYAYGKITSHNGRLIISKPTTVLSGGHLRALALEDAEFNEGFKIDTEDGNLNGIATRIDKALGFSTGFISGISTRGILSYPDARANYVGGGDPGDLMYIRKCKANALSNISCVYDGGLIEDFDLGISQDPDNIDNYLFKTDYSIFFPYWTKNTIVAAEDITLRKAFYSSENRVQFSEAGEFRVWPAINSYRVGEGKIMAVGINNVDPANAEVVAPLLIGTSDGVYTINLDQTGASLVSSITKTKNIPYLSEETLDIDGMLIFVSDKGLMAINNGNIINLTADFFPDQGNGNFPDQETVYPNYGVLTLPYFGAGGNPFILDDIVSYMKGAILAYDGRRNNIWCCNPTYNFSLVYNLPYKMWGMSTTTFTDNPELYSILVTPIGEIYSRFMIKSPANDNLLILSGEDMDTEVIIHLLTRPIKVQDSNNYKKLKGLYSRCQLFRDNTGTGYFSFGAWGKQDHNKYKRAIPIAAKNDNRAVVYPGNVRQDIPVGWQKGKYKSIIILQGGKTLPDSSIDRYDLDALLVNEVRTR